MKTFDRIDKEEKQLDKGRLLPLKTQGSQLTL